MYKSQFLNIFGKNAMFRIYIIFLSSLSLLFGWGGGGGRKTQDMDCATYREVFSI